MAIKIVTDSTVGVEREFADKNGITVVPLTVSFSDEIFVEGYPGEYDAFYDKLARSNEFPKTSLPSPALFSEVFRKIIEDGDEAICITISSSLSGTYGSAALAAESFPGKVSVIDSGACCQGILFMIEEAMEMAEKGIDRLTIADHISSMRDKVFMQFLPINLDYLKKGGRISLIKASIGNLLHIKPLLLFRAGKLVNNKTTIGITKAINEMIGAVSEKIKQIFVVCIGHNEQFEMLKIKVKAAFKDIQIRIGEISPVMGTHVGPGSMGIACLTY